MLVRLALNELGYAGVVASAVVHLLFTEKGYDLWMESYQLALVLRPFAALVLLGLICLPVRIAAQRWLPEGRLKRLLLLRISNA